MGESINCNYARVAIRHFSSTHLPKSCRFPKGSISKILADYNNHFVDNESLRETYSRASKKFPAICQNFNLRWHPAEKREEYLATFSVVSWLKLSPEEKQQHSLQSCKACGTQYQTLSSAFPSKRIIKKKPVISFSGADLSSPKAFGRKALKELNGMTHEKFGKPIQEVLSETPRSQICKKPTSNERKAEKRRLEREIRDDIQKEMDEHGAQIVMENRISWSAFNKIRKTEGLASTPKRKRPDNSEGLPSTKRKRHGCKPNNLAINKEELLQEARMWTPQEHVNWSQLAARYGLTTSNRGQMIKEFLKEENIPAACVDQRSNTPRRPKRKFKSGRTSLPMHKPISYQKQKIEEKVEKGELTLSRAYVIIAHTRWAGIFADFN